MRKFLFLMCTVALLLGTCVGVAAEEAAPAEEASAEEPSQDVSPVAGELEIIIGEIIEETEDQIRVQGIDDEEYVMVLNVTPDTVVVDAVTGMSAGLSTRENELVKVYYGPTQTMSMPPISNAVIIAVNRQEDQFTPNYTVVEEVKIEDDTAYITADNGSAIISVSRDATVLPYLTKNIVTIDDIKAGSELLLWDELALLSFPSQSGSGLVVILSTPVAEEPAAEVPEVEEPAAEVPEAQEPAAEAPVVEEPAAEVPVEIEMTTEAVDINGIGMYPVRAECEALGAAVNWNQESGAEIVYGGKTVVIAPDMAVSANGSAVSLSRSPVIVNDRTYAIQEFFELFK